MTVDPSFKKAINALENSTGVVSSETHEWYRVDGWSCAVDADVETISTLHSILSSTNLGTLSAYGDISGPLDLTTLNCDQVQDEAISIIFHKTPPPDLAVFFTVGGFVQYLMSTTTFKERILVLEEFDEFQTHRSRISSWGTSAAVLSTDFLTCVSPRKLVRDRTHSRTPIDIAPWLLKIPPVRGSAVFGKWQEAASERLAFSIPFEIIDDEEHTFVSFKGPRTRSIPATFDQIDASTFDDLSEAANWIYLDRRDTETKFTFLNYHLSLDWHEGQTWPAGISSAIQSSLISARDAFSFHLQEESRDALKALSELRKALLDDISKTQQATRDLIASLWRDFAIAGAVLALRYVPANQGLVAFWLQVITVSSAVLLLLSLVVNLWTNYRFQRLSDNSRQNWRKRIYAFIAADEWSRLVTAPLSSSRSTYTFVSIVVTLLYLVVAGYLLYVAGAAPFFSGVWEAVTSYIFTSTANSPKPPTLP